uniref:Putative ovule protein n=1 Tax=Solanum chacoense TaxID=4108 RepID=A0A0V0GJS3_SOLCH
MSNYLANQMAHDTQQAILLNVVAEDKFRNNVKGKANAQSILLEGPRPKKCDVHNHYSIKDHITKGIPNARVS